jgi:hypothetical protein
MELYIACITAQLPNQTTAKACTVLAPNEAEAYNAALLSCLATYPARLGYHSHKAVVDKILTEGQPLPLNSPPGTIYILVLHNLKSQEGEPK